MRRSFFSNWYSCLVVIMLLTRLCTFAATRTSVAPGGAWNNPNTWNPTGNPKNGDIIIIASGTTVTITTDELCSDLTIQAGGTLQGDDLAHLLWVGKGGGEDVTNSGTLNANGLTLKLQANSQWAGTGGTWNLMSVNLNGKNLTFTNGATLVLHLSGGGDPFLNYGKFISNASATVTFDYNGTSAQVLTSNPNSVYGNIATNNPAGVMLSMALTTTNVLGNIQIKSGAFTNNALSITGNVGKAFVISNGATFVMTGNSGMVTGFNKTFGTTSTVDYAGTNQTVSNESYGHLSLSGSGTKTMPSSALNVAGNFAVAGSASVSAASALTIDGSFRVGLSSSFNAGTFAHAVKGDFTTDGSFSPSTGSFTFIGSGSQTIGGSAPPLFNDFIVNNDAGLLLVTPTTINGAMSFVTGRVSLSSSNLTIGPSGTISGASAANYVVTNGTGKLVRIVGTSAVLFPIGTAIGYAPATLRTGTGTDNFFARVIPGLSPSTSNDAAAIHCMWDISESAPNGNTPITASVQWNLSDEGPLFSRAAAISLRHNGTIWIQDGTLTSVTGLDPFTGTVEFISSLGNFTVANDGALPIQLTHFTASTNWNSVGLAWGTMSETNNFGFYVQRRLENTANYTDLPNSFVAGHGTTLEPHEYTWTDMNVQNGTYYYRLKQVDLDGTMHFTDGVRVLVSTLADVKELAPKVFNLAQNYPNPFNPTTTIEFTVEKDGYTTLTLHNILGQEIAVLFTGTAISGRRYSMQFDGSELTNGIYFFRLTSAKQSALRKMILLK